MTAIRGRDTGDTGLGRFLRAPMLHFLVLGAGLFLLSSLVRGPEAAPGDRIHVDAMRVEQLAQEFASTWQRTPTRQKLDGLVDEFVREEVYYREAIAMGLHRDDTVVRRRMRQKLEFLSHDVGPVVEPDDAALARHLAAHADAYRIEPRLALRQVFVSRDRRGHAALVDARALLARLAADSAAASAGDSSLTPASFPLSSLREIGRVFGGTFAAKVAKLAPGRWSGPVESGFGLHLVFVEQHESGRPARLDEVREAVRSDWRDARRAEANAAF